jgi:hypothetical protein
MAKNDERSRDLMAVADMTIRISRFTDAAMEDGVESATGR